MIRVAAPLSLKDGALYSGNIDDLKKALWAGLNY